MLRSDVLHVLGHRLNNLTELLVLRLKMDDSVFLVSFRADVDLGDDHGSSSLINIFLLHRKHSNVISILSKCLLHHSRVIDLLLFSMCYDLLTILQVTLLSCWVVVVAILADVVLYEV